MTTHSPLPLAISCADSKSEREMPGTFTPKPELAAAEFAAAHFPRRTRKHVQLMLLEPPHGSGGGNP